MKKSFLAIMLLGALISCSKSNLNNTTELNDNITSVINQKSLSTMRLAQTMLTGAEKKSLWLTKYNAILENDKEQLTIKQKEIVLKLKKFLETYDFDNKQQFQKIGQDFANSNMEDFEKNFTSKQLFVLIELPFYQDNFSIFKSEQYLNVMEEEDYDENPDGGPAPKCNCFWSLSCLPSVCKTSNATCTRVTSCGLWGDSNCTGRCG